MDYIFYQVAAINGFDAFGHYLRAALLVNTCSTYAIDAVAGCSANFQTGRSASASASATPRCGAATSAARLRDRAQPRTSAA